MKPRIQDKFTLGTPSIHLILADLQANGVSTHERAMEVASVSNPLAACALKWLVDGGLAKRERVTGRGRGRWTYVYAPTRVAAGVLPLLRLAHESLAQAETAAAAHPLLRDEIETLTLRVRRVWAIAEGRT